MSSVLIHYTARLTVVLKEEWDLLIEENGYENK